MHNSLIPLARKEDIVAVDQFSREARHEIAVAQKENNRMALALMTARAVQGLRELVTPEMMTDIMLLMNTQVGFDTDRNPAKPGKNGQVPVPYGVDVVKDCFITAQLWGASPINNEFNILAGRTYRTVNYYRRMVRGVQGVSDVNVQISTPEYAQVNDGRVARVACVGTWRQDGKQRRVACLKDATGDWRISVKCNAYMGDDGVKGKAERKLLAIMFSEMSGCPVEEDDDSNPVDDPLVVDGEFTVVPEGQSAAPESAGDDIAAATRESLADQTPPPAAAGPVVSEAKRMALETMRLKTGAKAVAAWVAHCAGMSPSVDISAEADAYIKELAARK